MNSATYTFLEPIYIHVPNYYNVKEDKDNKGGSS